MKERERGTAYGSIPELIPQLPCPLPKPFLLHGDGNDGDGNGGNDDDKDDHGE